MQNKQIEFVALLNMVAAAVLKPNLCIVLIRFFQTIALM